jgi:hypothetical protein
MIFEYEGKKHRIPDEDLQRLQRTMGISEKEAIWIWLEDEGIVENEEQIALDNKAKENRITATIHQARAYNPNKTQKERVKKDDPTKEGIISAIAELLNDLAENVEIVNKGKLITFKMGEENFKLDLIRQRPPKQKGK